MTTPDKLSRERLEGMRDPSYTEAWSMAVEILELRDEIARLRAAHDNPIRGVTDLPPTATEQVMCSPDPDIVRLRLRIDALEQKMTERRPIGPPIQIWYGTPPQT